MRLCELRDKKVCTLDGKTLGRVHDVHCDKGKVVALMCGPGSFIERWTGRKGGERIAWDFVRRIDADAIVVSDERVSAARSRQGTRPPSEPRSKR